MNIDPNGIKPQPGERWRTADGTIYIAEGCGTKWLVCHAAAGGPTRWLHVKDIFKVLDEEPAASPVVAPTARPSSDALDKEFLGDE